MNNNKKKAEQLGMPHGTASARLKKDILFSLLCEFDLNDCYRCGEVIEYSDDLSIDHKVPWLDSKNPIGLYFDLDNIAFSHLNCNTKASRPRKKEKINHGTQSGYSGRHKCRCTKCTEAHRKHAVEYRDEYGR